MNVTKDSVLNERHQKMLAYQEERNCPPTLRGLEELWGLTTTSAASYVLHKMVKKGMVKELPRGKYHQYLAVNIAEVNNDNGN